MTIQEALDRVWSDEALRKRLLSDPKPVLKEFGMELKDSVSIQVHENTPTLMNVVLPVKPADAAPAQSNDPVVSTIERAWKDSGFKARLLSNPKDAAAEMGVRVPEAVQVKVWENTPTVEHIVLPMNPAITELSEADLEAVAGGALSKATQAKGGCGVGSVIAGFIPVVGSVVSQATKLGSTVGGAIATSGGKC